jgi:hypothetical protein
MNGHLDILSEVNFVRFGTTLSAENKAELLWELVIFQRALRRTGRPIISEQAIRAWFPDNGPLGQPKRATSMEFISSYLNSLKDKKAIPEGERSSRFHALALSLSLSGESLGRDASDFVTRDAGDQLAALRVLRPDPLAVLALQVLAAVSNRNKRSELDDFFRGGDVSDPTDQSYFLMYRYSTTGGNVLKTFLVVKKPRTDLSTFSFSHFIWPSTSNKIQIFRECEGFILKLDRAYYLFGYNYEVKENKRFYLREYLKKRTASKLNPNGIGTIAVEYESIDESLGLWGGTTMTLAASNQPIIARVVLMHLGTRSALGVGLNDTIVQPSELEAGKFASVVDAVGGDLKTVVSNIRNLGAKRFAERLETTLNTPNWEIALANDIDLRIRNVPAWDMAPTNPQNHRRNGRKASTLQQEAGRGAIETIGKHRP